jgi:Ca-activated chloride channel family protein
VLGDFLTKRVGDRAGSWVFGDAPFLQAPFTDDWNYAASCWTKPLFAWLDHERLWRRDWTGITLFEKSTETAPRTIIALPTATTRRVQFHPSEAAKVRMIEKSPFTPGRRRSMTVGEEKLDESGVAERGGIDRRHLLQGW